MFSLSLGGIHQVFHFFRFPTWIINNDILQPIHTRKLLLALIKKMLVVCFLDGSFYMISMGKVLSRNTVNATTARTVFRELQNWKSFNSIKNPFLIKTLFVWAEFDALKWMNAFFNNRSEWHTTNLPVNFIWS